MLWMTSSEDHPLCRHKLPLHASKGPMPRSFNVCIVYMPCCEAFHVLNKAKQGCSTKSWSSLLLTACRFPRLHWNQPWNISVVLFVMPRRKSTPTCTCDFHDIEIENSCPDFRLVAELTLTLAVCPVPRVSPFWSGTGKTETFGT